MIDIWCPRHGHRVLVSWGRLQSMENREDGITSSSAAGAAEAIRRARRPNGGRRLATQPFRGRSSPGALVTLCGVWRLYCWWPQRHDQVHPAVALWDLGSHPQVLADATSAWRSPRTPALLTREQPADPAAPAWELDCPTTLGTWVASGGGRRWCRSRRVSAPPRRPGTARGPCWAGGPDRPRASSCSVVTTKPILERRPGPARKRLPNHVGNRHRLRSAPTK